MNNQNNQYPLGGYNQNQYNQQGMPVDNQMYGMNQTQKHSGLAIAAFVLALLGCTSLIGLILGIVDVAVNKQHKHGLSIAAIVIASFWIICGAVGTITHNDATSTDTQQATEQASDNIENSSDNTEHKGTEELPKESVDNNLELENNSTDAKEEFIASCNTYSYDEILRAPDSYKNVNCKLSGDIDQIIEGWFGSYSIFITDIDGNKWGCTYKYSDGESHVLEGDSVTIYGVLNGTTTTETILGKQVVLPYISIKYIESYTSNIEGTDEDTSGMTMGQQKAIKSAKSYLKYSAFSRNGLVKQLSSEYGDGYSSEDAEFAVSYLEQNNLVDWNEQAYKSAKSYLEYSSFSRDGLYKQLTSEYGEGFTSEEAEYALQKVGY